MIYFFPIAFVFGLVWVVWAFTSTNSTFETESSAVEPSDSIQAGNRDEAKKKEWPEIDTESRV